MGADATERALWGRDLPRKGGEVQRGPGAVAGRARADAGRFLVSKCSGIS